MSKDLEQLSPNLELACHGFSGALGSVITTILLYPIDNIRTKMQVSTKKKNGDEDSKEFFPLLKETVLKESFFELYTGLSADVIGNYISNGTYFFIYEKVKKQVDISNFIGYVKAAMVASSLTTVITNPFRVLNTRMIIKNKVEAVESTTKERKTILTHISEVYQSEGLKGFFKGTRSSLLLIINPIINYVIYEYLKKYFKDSSKKTLMFFISGAVSKAIATVITYPVQVIRTNIMVEKKNPKEIVEKIVKRDGLKGFFAGLPPKLVQSVINSAIMLFLYEKLFKINKVLFLLIAKNLAK